MTWRALSISPYLAHGADLHAERAVRVCSSRALCGQRQLREQRFPSARAAPVRRRHKRMVREQQQRPRQAEGDPRRAAAAGLRNTGGGARAGAAQAAEHAERGARETARELAAIRRREGRRLALALVPGRN